MKEEQFWVLLSKKLLGEANPEELNSLQEYLNSNRDWLLAHDQLHEFCESKAMENSSMLQHKEDAYLNHINRLKEQVADFNEVDQLDEMPEINTGKRKLIRLAKIGGILSLTCILFFYFIGFNSTSNADLANNKTKPAHSEVKVSFGSKSKIQLPDGTQVWINSGSKLTYSGTFKGNLREVFLDGEAYFDVVHDAERLFIVHTSNIDIKVLGTSFNVKAYDVDKSIEATLIHGSIEVVNRNQPDAPKIMLKPHEKIIFNKELETATYNHVDASGINKPSEMSASSTILIKPLPKNIADSVIHETSWLYNKLVFDEEAMTEVVTKLERWYDVKIEITDDRVKNYRISGTFIDETVEQALNDLQLLIPFKYSNNNNLIIISKKN
jgi:ferric-dicitrate binding protein FerR (iron transport regulator)